VSGHAVGLFPTASFRLQQLGFRILNEITWEKPNPPPNLGCRCFTHSTETVLWAARTEKSKHTFNYDLMRQTNGGKQIKTVWRNLECGDTSPLSNDATCRVEQSAAIASPSPGGDVPSRGSARDEGERLLQYARLTLAFTNLNVSE
jgi:DNA modification methylase